MLNNNNNTMSFNSFKEMPLFPYRIITALLNDNSETANQFCKLLKYTTIDALEKPNLSYDEKIKLIWDGEDSVEQNYSIFLKPLIASSLGDDAESQIQLRLYRSSTSPTNQYEAIICFEADFITHEKTCLIRKDGILCERTDLLESLFLDLMNGRDIHIGSGVFVFDRELTRSCNSQLNISNSKSLYGRSLVMALRFIGAESGDGCG